MARNRHPQRSVGPVAWRCLEFLGGIVGFVGFGTSISAEDVAFASAAILLQGGMAIGSCPPDVVRCAVHRPRPRHVHRGRRGSCLYSLVLRSGTLREGAWR